MTTPTDEQRRAWMAQWRSAAVALERVRVQELDTADLSRIAADLDDACLATVRARGPEPYSGLIEQQRILNRRPGGE
jgi:hypothetical protein